MTGTAGGQVVFREIDKYFGDFPAVEIDLNLTIRRGEFFTLLGPSGSRQDNYPSYARRP